MLSFILLFLLTSAHAQTYNDFTPEGHLNNLAANSGNDWTYREEDLFILDLQRQRAKIATKLAAVDAAIISAAWACELQRGDYTMLLREIEHQDRLMMDDKIVNAKKLLQEVELNRAPAAASAYREALEKRKLLLTELKIVLADITLLSRYHNDARLTQGNLPEVPRVYRGGKLLTGIAFPPSFDGCPER